jgi:hypothetical protein
VIQVYRIPVPKERLRAMPKNERVLLLLLGYVSNQLSMLQKLLTFATNITPAEELEQHASGAQTQMLVRLTVGALNEAWELVRTRFIETTMAKDYLSRLDEAGREAFTSLKRQFGGSNLLSQIRKNYAFHYPSSDDVDQALDAICDNDELSRLLNLYFSRHGFNSLFLISDLVFMQGIAHKLGEYDLHEAQKKLMGEVSTASINLIEFARAFAAAAWRKHFGWEMLAKDMVTVADAPNVDNVWLPFFVEMEPAPANSVTAAAISQDDLGKAH